MPGERSNLDQTRLKKLARRLAYNEAKHEDPETTCQDLQQVGWLIYLKHGNPKFLWSDIEYGMRAFLARWKHEARAGRRQYRQKVKMDSCYEMPSANNPERDVQVQQCLDEIEEMINCDTDSLGRRLTRSKRRIAWNFFILNDATYVDRETIKAAGLSYWPTWKLRHKIAAIIKKHLE